MKIGIGMFPNAESASPAEVARLAEERGIESLWVAEHSHIPVGTVAGDGSPLARRYYKTLDPFVALTAAAAVTARLKVATGVALVPQRDPIITAKEVASLDVVSGGRFLFGVGAGWNRQEMRDHGTDPRTRMRLFTERMQAMIALWTQEQAQFHGKMVDFGPTFADPKPIQRPHPPVHVGGDGPTVEDRVVAFGDGWSPNHRVGSEKQVLERFERMRQRAGRPLELTAAGAPLDRADLARLSEAGVDRAFVWLPQEDDRDAVISVGEVERFLDRLVAAAPDGSGVSR
jgi:probable F420-dependent oxidoreductase